MKRCVDAFKVHLMYFLLFLRKRLSQKKTYIFNIDPDVTSIAAR